MAVPLSQPYWELGLQAYTISPHAEYEFYVWGGICRHVSASVCEDP